MKAKHVFTTLAIAFTMGIGVAAGLSTGRKAKAVNFGIIYGQTRYGLAKALDISPNEAQDFIDIYFLTFPV